MNNRAPQYTAINVHIARASGAPDASPAGNTSDTPANPKFTPMMNAAYTQNSRRMNGCNGASNTGQFITRGTANAPSTMPTCTSPLNHMNVASFITPSSPST